MRTTRTLVTSSVATVGAGLALAVALTTGPAQAAFPGQNGRIAFVTARDGNSEVYVMNADGGGQTNVTNNPAGDSGAKFSADGRKIVFQSNRDSGDAEIYSMHSGGSGQTRLTDSAGVDFQPAYSPDAAKIAFASDRDGDFDIYVMNADGTGQTDVTQTGFAEICPVFSPDGTKVAYHGGPSNNEIWIKNADGTGSPTNLTNTAAAEECPDFSPDGAKIAFSSERDSGNEEVYVMDVNGDNPTRLTTTAANVKDENPAFSPDGTRIAFHRCADASATFCNVANSRIVVMDADGTDQVEITAATAHSVIPSWGHAVPPPANSVAPSIPASAVEGQALTCDPGTWSESPGFTFEWLRDGTPIAGATGATYTITAADVGRQISCRVTATSLTGLTGQGTSNSVVPVPAPDTSPPDTTITEGPSGTIADDTPTFAFTSSEAGSSFECAIDGAAFSSCSSPLTTTALANGAHSFAVRAVDPAGNRDATPATAAFTVSITPATTSTPPPTAREQALATAPANQVATAFGLPSARRCVSRRNFPIHIRRPSGVRIVTVTVRLENKRVRVRRSRGRFVARIDLRGFPKGRFTVTIRVKTVSGLTLRGARRYRTCVARRP